MAGAMWLCGSRSAPITRRVDVPVTRELAESERIAALLSLDELFGPPRFPAEAYCADMGVTFVEPRPVSSRWAEGVHATLRWVLGRQGIDGPVGPPISLPERRADGTLITAEEIYEREVARAGVSLGPEQRAELRRGAAAAEQRTRRLAARVLELQRAAWRS